ncbi:hypothetical protein SSX86_027787 [Deinandra increscens subsp. villosa]|uniref:F-box domain-containing protein n=1 Tax=Deinandra increscens subsp. villosa TaxID=3103831 RepID=A0AAP0C6Q3_9ASTR
MHPPYENQLFWHAGRRNFLRMQAAVTHQRRRLMDSNATEPAPKDIISSMPDDVVAHILDRLPLQDAVKTGILSRNWRFKWTMLTQLVFDEVFFRYLLETKRENRYGEIISRLLLHLKGVISKFVLYIDQQTYPILEDEHIANWILFLSRKGIKDLIIQNILDQPLKLPTHLFTCVELKHLKLVNCCFDPPASFHGFPNLLSLELSRVQNESKKLGEFFSRCPVLEILTMGFTFSAHEVKLAEIAKLTNLKILSLYLRNFEKCMITSPDGIFELLGFLPKLQELRLDFLQCKSFTEDGAKKRSPTTFPCLKTLDLSYIDLGSGIVLSFAFEIIRSSWNLQTLEIMTGQQDVHPPPAICSPEVDYNTVGFLQLQRVTFTSSMASENEVCLIKYLLACSPFLKEIFLYPHLFVARDEQLMFAKKLLKLHRASPVAEICFF